jgi:hypothetical protein
MTTFLLSSGRSGPGTAICMLDAKSSSLTTLQSAIKQLAGNQGGRESLSVWVPIGSAKEIIPLGGPIHFDNLKSDYIATYTLDKEHVFVK